MTAIDPILRHGGTFNVVLNPNWPLTGMWDAVDELAAEHHEAVATYHEAVESAPKRPSLTEYNKACEQAIRDGEALPEPPPSPAEADIKAGEVRVRAAAERVMETATAILHHCRHNGAQMAEAPTIREPIAAADARIAELRREIDELERAKAPFVRIPMWIERNARQPWTDPNPEHYPDPTNSAVAELMANATGAKR